tara:strand:- start:435 stop:1604 length:1170 start_codon:yes stop_codon:yes gene_type:complete
MKIVIAPDSYKGSIYAPDAAKAMAEGVLRVLPNADIDIVPIADGGDGTLETLVEISSGQIETLEVTGPLGNPIHAEWGAMGDKTTAVIEMARTSGLALVPTDQRNPLIATTFGLGEIISKALDSGFRNFIIGIGGSATNDAGAGMAQALGIKLLDSYGNNIEFGGAELLKLHSIDFSNVDPRIQESSFEVACDVNNPLTGPNGASAVYGPQKGANQKMISLLDKALLNFAKIVVRDLGKNIKDVPGSGAAGGLGGGIMAFLGGNLRPGVDIILDKVNLNNHLEGADLIVTGEGCMDFQTVFNKAPIGVANMARPLGIPVIGISGSLGERFTDVHDHGISAAHSITNRPMTLEDASQNAAALISDATEQAIRLIKTGSMIFGNNKHNEHF